MASENNSNVYSTTVAVVYGIVYVSAAIYTSIKSLFDVRRDRKERKVKEAKELAEMKVKKQSEQKTDETKNIQNSDKQSQISQKNEIYDKNAFKHWAKLVYAKKKVYWALIPHIFDQAVCVYILLLTL